ncbi:MAG TPA: flagellar motor protein MotB [Pirellulaceae bacterium]|nr:flagellar motor protein MotB [Pirellulaceae bacterium]
MSRKPKPPPKKPSKAYLVSFGDTMTALLAFFIVLNSLAKDQTGANMYTGTGSFVRAFKRTGSEGNRWGTRSDQNIPRVAPSPVYAIPSPKRDENDRREKGPDQTDNGERVINRREEDFQRFLTEMRFHFQVNQAETTQSQIVFDSFERLGSGSDNILGPNAMQIVSDAIGQLANRQFEIEIVVWSVSPNELELQRAMDQALQIESYLDRVFRFRNDQRNRFSIAAKPWLFVDAKRPKMSVILSRLQSD